MLVVRIMLVGRVKPTTSLTLPFNSPNQPYNSQILVRELNPQTLSNVTNVLWYNPFSYFFKMQSLLSFHADCLFG